MALIRYIATPFGNVSDVPFHFVASKTNLDRGVQYETNGSTFWIAGYNSEHKLFYGNTKYDNGRPLWTVELGHSEDISSGPVWNRLNKQGKIVKRAYSVIYLNFYHPTHEPVLYSSFSLKPIDQLSDLDKDFDIGMDDRLGKIYALNPDYPYCPIGNTWTDFDCDITFEYQRINDSYRKCFKYYDGQVINFKGKRFKTNVTAENYPTSGIIDFELKDSLLKVNAYTVDGYTVKKVKLVLSFYHNNTFKTVEKELFSSSTNGASDDVEISVDLDDYPEAYYTNDYKLTAEFVEKIPFRVRAFTTEFNGLGYVERVEQFNDNWIVIGDNSDETNNHKVTFEAYVRSHEYVRAVVRNPAVDEFVGWYKLVYPNVGVAIKENLQDEDIEFISSDPILDLYQEDDTPVNVVALFKAREQYTCRLKISDNTNATRDIVLLRDPDPYYDNESYNELNADCEIAPGCYASTTVNNSGNFTIYTEKAFRVSAYSGIGWEFVNFNVRDLDNKGRDIVSTSNPLELNIDFNCEIKVNFQRRKFAIDVEAMHSTSEDKKSNKYVEVSYESGTDGVPVDNIHYGDVVRFVATRKEYITEHEEDWFAGFFDAQGNLVNSGTYENNGSRVVYEVAASSSITLYANVKVNFTASVLNNVNGSIEVSYNDWTNGQNIISPSGNNGNITVSVPLGSEITVKAIPDDGKFFGGWYLAPYSIDSAPIPYGEEFSLTLDEDTIASHSLIAQDINASCSVVCEFLNVQNQVFIALKNYDFNAQRNDDNLGVLSLLPENDVFANRITEIDFEQYRQRIQSKFSSGGASLQGAEQEDEIAIKPGSRYYKIVGTIKTVVNAATAVGRGFVKWSVSYLGLSQSDNEVIEIPYDSDFSKESSTQLVTNRDWVLYAQWGDLRPIQITVSSGKDFSGLGIQDFYNPNDTLAKDSLGNVFCTFIQESFATIEATPYNGYKFEGWYIDEDCTIKISDKQKYTFKVEMQRTYYAKYIKESNAIFEWEGSVVNKVLTWRSRRYVFDAPVSFNSTRLYADGYPNRLNVYVAQSPDDDNPHLITRPLMNQNPSRLPLCRAEKYVEVELEGDNPVTNCAIATSMGALCQR